MAARVTNKDRINTVMPKLVVYRLGRADLSSQIVSIQNNNGENTAYLRFKMDQTQPAWTDFKNWWKKNDNSIILGCKIYNVQDNQNKGYYWCPTNRAPNPIRPDTYTNYLEFIIQRGDEGIYNSSDNTYYEFYFINLTH